MPLRDDDADAHKVRTDRGLALLQLFDRLPAEEAPAAKVEPVDPWAPVETVWGMAHWVPYKHSERVLLVDGSRHVADAIACISMQSPSSWQAYGGRIGISSQIARNTAPTPETAIAEVLVALGNFGSLPPLPTQKEG
jgi:hypothetical protein